MPLFATSLHVCLSAANSSYNNFNPIKVYQIEAYVAVSRVAREVLSCEFYCFIVAKFLAIVSSITYSDQIPVAYYVNTTAL
jgi:hypothetical protein